MTLSTVQELPNRVDATGDEATIGSTTGVDANDPERLTHSGTAHYAYFPGTADNNLTVPDEAALDITDDLEIVFRLAPDDWTPAAAETIVNKSSSTYAARIQTSGDVRLYINNVGYDSTIAPTITDGVALWIKITRDRSTGDIDFYTAADQATEPSSWDTLGTTVAGVTDAIATGAADFYIGTNNSGTAPLQGIIQRVIVRSTIGGAAILDVNLPVDIDTSSDPDAGQTSFTCTTGQTVTVNRATSGLVTAIVTRPVALLDGIATYVQLPADAPTPTATRAAGKHTAVFLLRKSATGANFDRFLSFETGTGVDGCYLTQVGNQTAVYIGDGASSVSSLLTSTIPDNDLAVIGFVIDTGTIAAYYYGEGLATPTSFSGLASDPTFTAGRIGARGYAVQSLAELEFFDVVTFQDQAKTEAQLDVIAAKLLAGTYA